MAIKSVDYEKYVTMAVNDLAKIKDFDYRIEQQKQIVKLRYAAIDGGGNSESEKIPQPHITGDEKAKQRQHRVWMWEKECSELDQLCAKRRNKIILLCILESVDHWAPLYLIGKLRNHGCSGMNGYKAWLSHDENKKMFPMKVALSWVKRSKLYEHPDDYKMWSDKATDSIDEFIHNTYFSNTNKG